MLDNYVAIYVPKRAGFVILATEQFDDWFGNVTATNSKEYDRVITIVKSFYHYSPANEDPISQTIHLAKALIFDMHLETITIEHNGTLQFIRAS